MTIGAVAVVQEPRRPLIRATWLLLATALLGLLAAGWVVVFAVSGSERDRADSRLAAGARSAAAALTADVAAADSRAGFVASLPALQRALVNRNVSALRALVERRHNVAVYMRGRLVAGGVPAGSIARSVAVATRRRTLGRVVAYVPVNAAYAASLAARVGITRPDQLRVLGPSQPQPGVVGRAFDTRGGPKLRAFAVNVLSSPQAVSLEVVTPRSSIAGRAHRRVWWLVVATIASIATLAVLAFGVRRLIPPRRIVPRTGRDVRQVLALVGDALGSTHDPERLLPISLHAAMEATGALGGVAVRGGKEVAREGTFDATGAPLRLDLGDDAEEGVALVIYPPLRGFDSRTVALARTLATQASVALENARLHSLVKQQSVTDELTELANRRSFYETLETELQRAERFGTPLSLVYADLDDFKLVNDRFGHQAGDRVLRAFADVLRYRIRGIDLAARVGGEEFAILLPGTDEHGATALAENLRLAAADLSVATENGDIHMTASFGVAAFPQTHTADELMTSADLALYGAKRQGKNRVVTVEPRPG